MKIASVGFRYSNIHSRYNNIVHSSPIYSNAAVDTVTFSARRSIVERDLENLEDSFNNQVVPFMKDSKDLYTSVAKIGYAAQEAMKPYKKLSNDLFQYQLNLSFNNPSKNSKYDRALRIVSDYDTNVRNYNYIKKMSQKDEYKNPKLDKKVNAAEKMFLKNRHIENLRLFYNFYNDSVDGLNKKLLTFTLKNASKENYDKYVSLKDKFYESVVCAMAIPYSDAVKAQKSIAQIKHSVADPNTSIFDNLENIDKTQRQVDSIIERKKWFYENKSQIKKFVEDNAGIEKSVPDNDELIELFKDLKNKSDVVSKRYKELTAKYYKGTMELYRPKLDRLEKLVEKQRKVNKEMLDMLHL